MVWYHYVSYFFAGLFLTNSVPHLVSGMMGRPFQSPFAKPPGEGLSSSTVNVLWGWFNVAVGYVLLFQVGVFNPRNLGHVTSIAVPGVVGALFHAKHFGRFHGGNDPK